MKVVLTRRNQAYNTSTKLDWDDYKKKIARKAVDGKLRKFIPGGNDNYSSRIAAQ